MKRMVWWCNNWKLIKYEEEGDKKDKKRDIETNVITSTQQQQQQQQEFDLL